MANYVKIFANRVSEARKARGWTQKKLAVESGLTQGMISVIEGGKGEDITMGTVKAISKAFGESVASLLGDVPLAAKTIPLDPTENERVLDLMRRFDLDPKALAICQLALTAKPELLNVMHDSLLRPAFEAVISETADHKKPSVG